MAIELIEGYVKRGDSLESLKAGQLCCFGSHWNASIGGWIDGKKLPNDKILVKSIGEKEVNEVFKLAEIYWSIKTKTLFS